MSGPDSLTELIFLMVILKIPIVYLCGVIYHAVKSAPNNGELQPVRVRVGPEGPLSGSHRPRRRPPRPHGGPARAYARTSRVAYARADRVGRG